jgi:UDP-N-acetylmuramoyl-tripeptide--D-alanyl-D-alanine ligase
MQNYLFSFSEISSITGGIWTDGSDLENHFVDRVSTDTRADNSNALFLALRGENFDAHDFLEDAVKSKASALLIEAGAVKKHAIPKDIPVISVDNTLKAYHSLALFHRRNLDNLTVIGLTGSSGKTSTKEILRSIFIKAFGQNAVYATEGNTNNHIGVPRNLLNLTDEHRIAIIEMGTNHPGEIEVLSGIAEPEIALITNIGRCHLEFFETLENVAIEKSAIFSYLKPAGTAIIPSQCKQSKILETAASSFNCLRFGKDENADIQSIHHGSSMYGSRFTLRDLKSGKQEEIEWKLLGEHQAVNAAGAACAAKAVGIDLEVIAEGLKSCSLPGMRSKITEREKVTWINDAYNANPDSVKAGLNWLGEFVDDQKLVLVLGDMLELGETGEEEHLKTIKNAMKKFPSARLVLVGKIMGQALKNSGIKENKLLFAYPDSKTAAKSVQKLLKSGDIIYLKASRGTRLERIEPEKV